jgi:site-specific DNA-methyltransferase (adenine-specific)
MNLTDKITVTNEDNMELMARYPDNYFDLAIVDPPYGLDFSKYNRVSKRSNGDRYISNDYKKGDWDKVTPNDLYFKELKRVSKHQIVWGGNYFPQLWTNGCKGFIFWYKGNPVPNFADGELAYCSMNKVAKQFDFRYYGNLEGNSSAKEKIHPTQKPVQLYEWLLDNYAKEGDKILDTHLGSGSIAIACHNRGFELTACELDKEYFDNFVKRFKSVTAQQTLF